jgi:hypothetical protein
LGSKHWQAMISICYSRTPIEISRFFPVFGVYHGKLGLKGISIGETIDMQIFANVGKDEFAMRLCALRKSDDEAEKAIKKAIRECGKKQRKINWETIELHRYIILVTSISAEATANQILELYRLRWQIEIAFKRLKSILGLGHLPKEDEKSARAWLHGKLFVALLAQAIVDEGRFFPPGDIRYYDLDDNSCLWRETSFAFHLIKQAINPQLSIMRCLENWKEISKDLAESLRSRKRQLSSAFSLS